jgi:hypothetical protein
MVSGRDIRRGWCSCCLVIVTLENVGRSVYGKNSGLGIAGLHPELDKMLQIHSYLLALISTYERIVYYLLIFSNLNLHDSKKMPSTPKLQELKRDAGWRGI